MKSNRVGRWRWTLVTDELGCDANDRVRWAPTRYYRHLSSSCRILSWFFVWGMRLYVSFSYFFQLRTPYLRVKLTHIRSSSLFLSLYPHYYVTKRRGEFGRSQTSVTHVEIFYTLCVQCRWENIYAIILSSLFLF